MGPLDLDPASQSKSGSGSRRVKITHKIERKKGNKFNILKCWMFSFEG
jgi:hypothetical protein